MGHVAGFSAGLSAKGGTTNGAARSQKTQWAGQINQEAGFLLEIDRQNSAT
jgi:hypothetical protein